MQNSLSVDITTLIRSIQRLEGNPDCFGMANGNCDRLDCAWRTYCLGKRYDHLKGEKEVFDEKNRNFVGQRRR